MKRTQKSCALTQHRSRRACREDTQNISKRTRHGYTLSGLCRLEQDVGMAVSIPGSKLEQRAKNYAFASYVRLQDSFRCSKCTLSTFPVLVRRALKINLCALTRDSLIALKLTKHLQILRSRRQVVCLPCKHIITSKLAFASSASCRFSIVLHIKKKNEQRGQILHQIFPTVAQTQLTCRRGCRSDIVAPVEVGPRSKVLFVASPFDGKAMERLTEASPEP